jgi:1,4-alpha-glucan branching enzyme
MSRKHFTPRSNNPRPLTDDPYLAEFSHILHDRAARVLDAEKKICGGDLCKFASGHEYFGLHFINNQWVFREWAPNASTIYLLGEFSDWHESPDFKLHKLEHGVWEIKLPPETLQHNMLYRLSMHWPGGQGDRIPAWSRRVVQDSHTHIFNAQVWIPEQEYTFENKSPELPSDAPLLIYEAHPGMATEAEDIGTYIEFKDQILPRIAKAGYNTVQIMAVMEHPYYGSFGYHISSFFAVSSRFGTPEEFKSLVDAAHKLGLRVIIDLVHSHAVRNEVEGLSKFDGSEYQYFHEGGRGMHDAWDSRCFDYSKPEVLHFLLSNCRFWLDEYHIDGFRFDGVTSMLYYHHGLGTAFTGYQDYFGSDVDEEAVTYLTLANKLIHKLRPDATTAAEDVSGMPGLAASIKSGGIGFDYRMAMGVTDYWFKLFDIRDEDWNMGSLWHELTNRRQDEKSVSYVECHDQALVGGKSAIFTLIDAAMYDSMHVNSQNVMVDRGIALHKISRLITLFTAGHGYLNFMGNEFGHPEWIDFPREGNDWSYKYARRQWSLAEASELRYNHLLTFDHAMLQLLQESPGIFGTCPQILKLDDNKKVIAFERGGLIFIFNFHPAESYTDYSLEVPMGKYRLLLDSDEPRFGGHNRIIPGQSFLAHPNQHERPRRYQIKLYLPNRCALVVSS